MDKTQERHTDRVDAEAILIILDEWRAYGELTEGALLDFVEQIALRPAYATMHLAQVVRTCLAQAGFAPAQSMAAIEQEIAAALARDQAQLTRERLQLAWKTKQRPVHEQGAPVGMFEQTQTTLF
jgi:multidrug efflux pump subunit AcrA (membrane-fusion protein)